MKTQINIKTELRKRIALMLQNNVHDAILENFFISYLEALNGRGIHLVFYLMNKTILAWINRKIFYAKYFWKVIVKGQSEVGFIANNIDMTEAELRAEDRNADL